MKGIDVPIEVLRQMFEDNLWTSFEFTAYGRIFPNATDKGIVPEVLVNGSREYLEKLYDDTKDAHCFFYVHPERNIDKSAQTAKVDILFTVNLEKLYSSVAERATEYAHLDVIAEIKQSEFDITGITTGIDSFRDFAFLNQNLNDMQPFYLFKISTEIIYNTTC